MPLSFFHCIEPSLSQCKSLQSLYAFSLKSSKDFTIFSIIFKPLENVGGRSFVIQIFGEGFTSLLPSHFSRCKLNHKCKHDDSFCKTRKSILQTNVMKQETHSYVWLNRWLGDMVQTDGGSKVKLGDLAATLEVCPSNAFVFYQKNQSFT